MITGFNHVSIVVPNLQAAIERLQSVYGLTAGEPKVNEQQGVRLVWIDLGNASIELMEPSRPNSPVAKFLERNPAGGIHHFCLNVENVDNAQGELSKGGVRVLGDGKPQYNVHGDPIAFIHPKDFLGALVELEQRHASNSSIGYESTDRHT
jgi:methylmalonyl-CoA/ethylmalonyl-CoA epimerase